MSTPKPKEIVRGWQVALFILFSPLLLIVVAIWFLCFLVAIFFLHVAIWSWWCIRGHDILFVYSDSPIWRDYIEKRILPRLGNRAVVLNWSQRKSWRFSLSRMAFYLLGGWQAFNPLAVVFRPFRRTRIFRFSSHSGNSSTDTQKHSSGWKATSLD